ncbi:MAG: serine/threonine protein kinase [Acidobacteria bacterium]|nr:serine/threonine protein kinase [Acidobacteriota bacterium]
MEVPHIIAGRFRIECEIGKGGMGTVYRATHLGLERPVAVKIIKQEFASDMEVAERFMREARTMAKLRHPHAAMIFDAGNLPDGRHFIVMEFVEGSTLSECLVREGRFTAERAVAIAADICDVLREAHRLGIVHRDLKPSNIMLNDRGVCVLDFGVAKVLATSAAAEAASTHATTGSGFIVGTPRYMSPEQCLGQKVGARSDLYSLGVLLFEMLAGQPPFTDTLPSAVLVKQATMPPPPLPKLRADIPRPLAMAVHTLLAKRPDDRPLDAAAAQRLLQRSLTRPDVDVPDAEPFASTVAALSNRPGILFRALTPLFLIAVLGTLLFVWGQSVTDNAPQAATMSQAALLPSQPSNATETSEPANSAPANPASAPAQNMSAPVTAASFAPEDTLSLDAARRIVSTVSHHSIAEVRVVRFGRETAIAAIHDEHETGTTHLFMMQKQNGQYRVTGRALLDKPDFRGAGWTFESMDVDGDGYDEVLCTGTKGKRSAATTRLLLYVPRTREAYSLRREPDARAAGKPHITLSANALTPEAAPYRALLQQRARALTGSF